MSQAPRPPISIRLLGPVEVLVGAAPLVVDTRKAIALLAYLAVAGRPVDREALTALLWPEAAGVDARGAFRRTLSVLNAGLGGMGLQIDRRAVALEPTAAEVDVVRFRAALDRARAHRHGPDEACPTCLGALGEAVALARGDFLEGFALRDSEEWDAWQLTETEACRRELAGALERLTRARAAAGDDAGAIDAAGRWVALDGIHEPAHRALMAALARAGETGAAIRQYRDAVAALDRELGVAPLAETTALYEAIRDGSFAQPAGAVPAPAAIEPAMGGAGAGSDGPGDGSRVRPGLPFVGRAAELATLRAAHAAASPDGRLVVVEGEPGIGKTRLAEELGALVRAAGGTVLTAAGYPGENSIAYGGIADLLRAGLALPEAGSRLRRVPDPQRAEAARLLPALLPPGGSRPRAAEGPGDRARLLDAVATVLAALASGRVPGLVVVDDFQWVDASTMEAVAFLGRRLTGRSILLVVAVRREDLDEEARALLASLERLREMLVVRLAPLDLPAVKQLVAAAGSTVDPVELAAESEGLPLFAVEALATPRGPGSLPAGVRALLDERLDALSDVAAQVLVAAAILGRAADVGALRATSGRSEDETVAAIEELLARGLLREATAADGAAVCDVAHAALREAAIDRTSLARRRLLHRRAAEALRAVPARSNDLARLARIAGHERAAGRDREAALAHREAGDLARSLYANREAIDHFQAALTLGHEDPSVLHEALGELRTRTGDYAGAVASLERAAATAAEPARLAAIERRLALAHQRRGDHPAAASHLEAALGLLEPGDPVLPRVVAEQAVVALGAGDLDGARERASAVLARGPGDPVAGAHAHRVLGLLAAAEGDAPAARASLGESLDLARRADDPGLAIAAHNALALVAAAAGDTPGALEHGAAALAEARRTGDLHLEAAVESNLADVLHAAGRDAESREHQLCAVALFAEVGGRSGELQPEIWKLSAW